jgi:hypothetical protein
VRHHVLGLAATALACTAIAVTAQETRQVHPGRGSSLGIFQTSVDRSPHVRSAWTVDGAKISIMYGRPYLKRRSVGKDVALYGKEWRTGADEATTLVTDKALTFGSLDVPAGTYTLYTLPGENEWQLIISKKTGQWGIPYPAGRDLGRVPMKVDTATTPVEQLTISIDDTSAGGTLKVAWGATVASAPFTVGGGARGDAAGN